MSHTCGNSLRLMLAAILWQLAACAWAQSGYAYKSVHTDGSVTYSDTRPASAETVTRVPMDTGAGEIEAQGAERLNQLETYNRLVDEERSARDEARAERQKKIAQARAEVDAAERALRDTRTSKKSATPERIRLMETQLRLARQRLRAVEQGAN